MDAGGAPNKFLPLLAAMLIYLLSFCPRVYSLATPAQHNASETDRHALLCLKSHLSDPAGALDSWRNESFTFCDWRGVTCSTGHSARVVSLNLESLNITGQIFPCIAGLLFLHEIHMANNQINGHIPPEISRLTQLRYLNLSMNSITGMIPTTISSCSLLEVIDLSLNSITGMIPNTISLCSRLEVIYLWNNSIEEYGLGYEISTAGDVYSYGIILLEMLTGKHPTDGIFKDGLNLHRLVISAVQQDIGDILETNLIPYYELEEANHNIESENYPVDRMQNCIMQLAKLGLKCSMDSPKDRPTIQEVHAEIITIKETFSALCS